MKKTIKSGVLELDERMSAEDADISLITLYLAKELPDTEMDAVEDRMKNDEAFFEMAWLLVQAWNHRVDTKVVPITSAPRAWYTRKAVVIQALAAASAVLFVAGRVTAR